MIPEKFIDYIPVWYERDEKLIAFADKMDSIIQDLKCDTICLNDLIDPVRMPVVVLDVWGNYLNAGIDVFDTEHTKRVKIATAIQAHKRRGSFTFDAKPKIDAIAGGDSQILKSFSGDDWIIPGDGETPSAFYWAAIGADGIDNDLGISIIGTGDEIEVAGNIYIDVDNSSLSASDQLLIRIALEDVVPAYMKVHIGYVDGTGAFIEYFVME